MSQNVIDSISEELTKLDSNPKLSRINPKLYTSKGKGIILEQYAKMLKLPTEKLRKVVKNNSFFNLGSTKIQTGLFSKRDVSVQTIEWADLDVVKKNYSQNPEKVINESSRSSILLHKMLGIITEAHASVKFQPRSEDAKLKFKYHQDDRIKLYEKYFPDELEKFQLEGKHESNLEKKFRKRMPKGAEFYFSDGKVANNLLTWVQCLHLAENDVIAFHVNNNEFYDWLENKVKVSELARIILLVSRQLQNDELSRKEVKRELLNGLNNTSLNNIIYETLIQPLLRTVKSTDQKKAQDAIDKLIQIGDERVVEPLMEKLFDSTPQVRRKLITGLGKLGDTRATPALVKILKHSTDNQDRLLAVKTLGILKDVRAVNPLKIAAKKNDEVGAEAKLVLENLGKRD